MPDETTGSAQTKRVRRPEEIRERVLDAAIEAFAISGFDGASTRAIARDAGISLPLMMYHFKSKDELWREVVRRMAGSITVFDILGDEDLSARERLRQVITRIVTAYATNPYIHRMMTQEALIASERLSWMCETLIRSDFDQMCALIEAAQKEGQVRSGDPARLRYAIVGMAATPFAVSAEYQYLTKRNPMARTEIRQTIELIESLIFTS